MTLPTALLPTPRQFAGVRPIVLDDGPERGVRCLAFSTGGGLDFWALADRSLDLGPLWWRGVPLAWQPPQGFASPALHRPEQEGGRGGFERMFGGLLITCGLDHVRQPDDAGHAVLHGRLPFTPARLLAQGEDWDAPTPMLFAEGEVVQARLGHEALRLRRRIEAPVGGGCLRILDTVSNEGSAPCPHAILYHINLGWPALADGTRVLLNRTLLDGPLQPGTATASAEARSWPAGPAAVAMCRVETRTGPASPLAVEVSFDADTLPCFQLWHDLRPRVCVLGIEPCSTAKGAETPLLPPGEVRRYRVEMTFTSLLPDEGAPG